MPNQLFIYHISGSSAPISHKKAILQLQGKLCILDADKVICINQILAALKRANLSENHNTMNAKIWGIEVILQVAGTHKISAALALLDITEETSNILIITEDPDIPTNFLPSLKQGFPTFNPSDKVLLDYNVSRINMCESVIMKGNLMVNDHE